MGPFRVAPEVVQSYIERGEPIPMGTVKLILALNILCRILEEPSDLAEPQDLTQTPQSPQSLK